jgi:hypothetical protein
MRPIQLSNHGSRNESSEANLLEVLLEVQNLLHALLCVREEVFCQINAALLSRRGQGMSCYEWLLLQLFPKEILGCSLLSKLDSRTY